MVMVFSLAMALLSSSFVLGGGAGVCGLGLVLLSGFMSFSVFTNMSTVCGGVMMDQLSYIMILMALMVSMASLVSSCKNLFVWEKVKGLSCKREFESAVASVAGSTVVVFLVGNIFLFFFFFELSLLPTLWLILSWGFNPERLQAGVAMMLYTVCSSAPMLIMLGHFYSWSFSGDYIVLKLGVFEGVSWFGGFQWFAWGCLMAGFLVKLPIFFVHMWLPKAHVEAPLAGSMLLAGVLLKLGVFGMMRFSDIFSVKSSYILSEGLLVLSVWGGVLTSCYCLCQSDIKALIAYSSIGHMAVCLLGVMSLCSLGWSGALCLSFAHGLCSPLLFSMAGSLYEWNHSQSVVLSKGLLLSFPSFVFWWCIGCMMNMGFPPSLNFIGEVMCTCSGVWTSSYFLFPMGITCFLSGAYCLYLYGSICHGSASKMVVNLGGLSERYLFSALFLSVYTLGGVMGADFFLM